MGMTFYAESADASSEPRTFNLSWPSVGPLIGYLVSRSPDAANAFAEITVQCLESKARAERVQATAAHLQAIEVTDAGAVAQLTRGLAEFFATAARHHCTVTALD
jgi:hypothetical protein